MSKCLVRLTTPILFVIHLFAQPPAGGPKPGPSIPDANTAPTFDSGEKAAPAEDDSKPVKRKWRPVTSLSNVMSKESDACLEAMMRLTAGSGPSHQSTGCESSQTPSVVAAERLVKELSSSASRKPPGVDATAANVKNAVWIIQVLDLNMSFNEKLKKYRTDVKSNRVLIYTNGQLQSDPSKLRIWGKSEIFTVFIGRNALIAKPDLTEKVWSSINETDLNASVIKTTKLLKAKYNVDKWGAGFLAAVSADGGRYAIPDFDVHQFAAAKAKNPAWLDNLIAIGKLGKLIPQSKAKLPELESAAATLFGLGYLKAVPVPSDLWIQAGVSRLSTKEWAEIGDEDTDAFKPEWKETKIDNEGKYWWDFSIGVPVKKIDELEYVVASNEVRTREVAAESILALVNIMPMPIDIKDPGSYWKPRLLIGLGLRGRVLDRAFVGIGIGLGIGPLGKNPFLREILPYVGVQRTVNRVILDAAGATPAQVQTSSAWKLAIGINVPVKSIADRLSGKKDDKK